MSVVQVEDESRARPRRPAGWAPLASRNRAWSRRELSRGRRLAISTAALVLALALWQILSSTKVINPLLFSSPWGVVKATRELSSTGQLWTALWTSTQLLLVGFGISVVSGILIGVLMGWYRTVEAAADPFVSVLYASPRIALIPLIMVWTGIGFTSQVVIVWSTAVFPIIINVAVGVRTADRQLLTVAQSFGAGSAQVLRTVALPGALPGIVAGLRQGLSLALLGVVVAEYFVGNDGVGGLIVSASQVLNSDEAFVGVLIFAIAAIALTSGLKLLERRLDGWRT